MAAAPFIAAAAASAAAVSSLMVTGQQRQVGAAQARALEVEASVARQQAGLQEEQLRRDTQRQFGELRAAGAQAGLLESTTFSDVYKQAATAAELDALSLAYQGETQAKSLLTEARITRASRPSWAQGILQASMLGIGQYAGAGGQLRSKPSPSQLTGVQVTGRRVPTTLTTTTPRGAGLIPR